MDKLPHELLHQIFINLTLMQKQECMYVSPLWRDIIRERSLLHTVYIPNRFIYHKLILLAQREPALAKQVEYIKVHRGQMDYCNTVWLLDLFPHLREIKLTYLSPSPITMVTKELDPITRKSHITCLRDSERCTLTQLLVDHHCQHLVRLSLKLITYINIPQDILALLKKMPSLKHLLLESVWVSIRDCETISDNAPQLESLELHYAIASESEIPRTVEPALKLKKFTLNLGQYSYGLYRHDWQKYIWKKYHSLQHLELFSDGNAGDFYGPRSKILFDVYGWKLTTLGLLNLGECNEDTIMTLLGGLGPRLTTLKIRSIGRDDVIVRALELSHQASLIQHLVLRDIQPSDFRFLNSFVQLNKFELHGDKWVGNSDLHMELHDVFQYMPDTVKTAVIHLCQAKATKPTQPLSIEHLDVTTSVPVMGIDDFISSSFPKLRRLTLGNCLQPNTMVKLQHFRLWYLEIKHMSHLSLTVGKDTYYYTVRPERKTKQIKDFTNLSEEYSPVLLDAVRSEEFLHVICRSVDTFVLNDAPASFLPGKCNMLLIFND
jgi:hypothetical protein